MRKFVMTVLLGFLGVNTLTFAAAYNPPIFSELVQEPRREVSITLENTSGQPDAQALEELASFIREDSRYFGDVVYLKVGSASETIDLTMIPMKGGKGEELKISQWARDVGTVIGGATGGISGSAKVGVEVTHTETKKDGTSTSTTVKVNIEVKGQRK